MMRLLGNNNAVCYILFSIGAVQFLTGLAAWAARFIDQDLNIPGLRWVVYNCQCGSFSWLDWVFPSAESFMFSWESLPSGFGRAPLSWAADYMWVFFACRHRRAWTC